MPKVWRKLMLTLESLANFLDEFQERNGPISLYRLDQKHYQFNMEEAIPLILLHENSFSAAKALLHDKKQV